jgi:hypothetical protein
MNIETLATDAIKAALLPEIEDFLDRQATSHPFQFPQWAAPGSSSFLVRDAGQLCCFGTFGLHSPLGTRFPLVRAWIANRGPVSDDHRVWRNAMEQLAVALAKRRIAYIDASPDWPLGTESLNPAFISGWRRIGPSRFSLRLDLQPADDAIFAGFRKNARYEVRRAERQGIAVTPASARSEVDAFLDLYLRLADHKGFAPEDTGRLRPIIAWLTHNPARGALLLARQDGIVHGGVVLGRAGRRCWYLWGASERRHTFDVGHILQWSALRWAKSAGCAEYDFGGYTPGATSGPAWFKAGFGGDLVEFVSPHRLVLRPASYRIVKIFSGTRDEFFPSQS